MTDPQRTFREQVERLFRANASRLQRYLQRLSGEAELAADPVQEAFVRLYRRGSLPESPEGWLIAVALNLYRNERSTRSRRRRILALDGGAALPSSPPAGPGGAARFAESRSVRQAIDRLPERERNLLLLHAEGFRYREIADALRLHEASIGTLLARARRAFREIYEDRSHAP
jgi:RNA polymerase sigma-70 factor (ECF subfamily)